MRSDRLALALVLLSLVPAGACKSSRASDRQQGSSANVAPGLPPLTLRDESVGLTFVYVTLDGGFRQVTKVAEVPYEARDAVRVWTASGDGVSGASIYVADLRTPLPDGTYKVDVVARSFFEDLATSRRNKPVSVGTTGGGETPGKGAPTGDQGATTVIVYGADWCKPCHDAERYLSSKGVPFVHKDIDEPENAEELGRKLRAAGIATHNIPVLDVGGKLLVGFSAAALDDALSRHKG